MSSLADSPEIEAMRRYIAIYARTRRAEAEAREGKAALKAMQPSLLAYLSAANMRSITIDDHMLTPHREPWIYPIAGVSRQRVCEALKIAGLGRMVREDYSTTQLTAYVKQLEAHGQLITGLEEGKSGLEELLHPALAEILRVQAAFSLHVRRSANSQDKYEGPQNPEEQGDDDE